MLYVGIDPGESWCGFAALETTSKGEVRVEARTYSVKSRGGYLQMAHDLVDLLPHARAACVVCEDFRIRRSGHQAFSRGDTLRFLGALEFGMTSVSGFRFFLIPPNDRGDAETKDLFGRVFFAYRQTWPRRRQSAWGHCVSAWRVLGNHLFQHDRDLLLRLRREKKSRACDRWLPTAVLASNTEHIAPAGLWIRAGR